MSRAPKALQLAALRLVKRAEQQAQLGNHTLLRILTDLLKPRVHHLLVEIVNNAERKNGLN